jgi:SAM-dependent methyltransferase
MKWMKTTSSGFESSKIFTYFHLLRFFKKNEEFGRHDYRGFLKTRDIFEEYLDIPVAGSRILEIGCGQRYVRTMLFHSGGAHVTGIDTDIIVPGFSPTGLMRILTANGTERFLKTLVRKIFFDRSYYRVVEREYGKRLNKKNLDLRYMSACALDFPHNHFDFIFSNAVFEHIDDVPAACSEVARVLKKDGYGYIGIHLFPSVSGGHHLDWAFPDTEPSAVVPPWDHLRENMYPSHVYLNKLKKDEYLTIFKEYFTIVALTPSYEGKELLTPEIKKELPGYTEEDLLTKGIKLLVKKK